jgi:hypothetical protein
MPDPQTPPDAAKPILDTLSVDNSVKKQAWDAFHNSQSPEAFRAYFDKAAIPQEAKRALWDAKFGGGTAAPVTGGTGMTPDAALSAMGAIGRAAAPAESEEGGFISGLLGSAEKIHPIEAIKNLWAAGKEEYQELKDHPLKTVLTLYGKSVMAQEEMGVGAPLNILKDLSGVQQQQQQHPNVGAEPFQVGQAIAPGFKAALPIGNIASAPNLPNAIGQGANAALGLIALLPEEKLLAGAPAITRGIAPNASAFSVWLENKLTKLPGSSFRLQRVYDTNQTLLRGTMAEATADAVNQAVPEVLRADVVKAGVKLDEAGRPILNLNPDEIVDNFNKGAKTLEATAKAHYGVEDKFVNAHQQEMADYIFHQIDAQEKGFYASVADHPILGMKMAIARLNQQAERLVNTGRGIEAHPIFQQADSLTQVLKDVREGCPPEVQKSMVEADRLWANKSALEDIAEVLKDPSMVHGAPPSAQSPLTKIQPQSVAGEKFLREVTMGDKAYRFQQVFGPDTTKEITNLADIIGKQQAIKGAGGQGIGGMIMGAGMLLGAMRGSAYAMMPLIGLDIMARAMASPDNWSLVKTMLTANPRVATVMIAPRILQNLRQQGQLPTYLYESLPQQQAPAAQPQPAQTTVPAGASIRDQLLAKQAALQANKPPVLPAAAPNMPSLPFHPGQGVPR